MSNLQDGLAAVLYQRKSTVSDGKSTRDQERENRDWCARNNVPVDESFTDEGISASRYARKTRGAWEELKCYLRPGHILVAAEPSRHTRDLEEFVTLRNLCSAKRVPLAYNGRVLDLTDGGDRFMGGLDALLAEREAEEIRGRVMRGKRGAALAGTPSSRPPWGYVSKPRKAGERPDWEVDPVEGPRLKEAVLRVTGGESLRSVRKWLASTGYAPATVTALRACISNPTITGQRVHQGKPIGKASWPPIITEEEQRKVIAAAARPAQEKHGPEPLYLCSGIATCGKCGTKLTHKKSQHDKSTYQCPEGHVTRFTPMLDAAVEKAVLRRLRHQDPADYKSDDPAIIKIERRIQELQADLDKWKKKAIAEEVDADTYAEIEQDRKRKIAELRPRTVPSVRPVLTYATWPQGTMREKRETVRALMTISVPPIKHLRRRATEDDVDITMK